MYRTDLKRNMANLTVLQLLLEMITYERKLLEEDLLTSTLKNINMNKYKLKIIVYYTFQYFLL